MRRLACLSLVWMLATQLVAQQVRRGSWNDVSAITPGAKVEVHTPKGERVRGRFHQASSDSVTLRVDSADRTIPRSEVRAFKLRRGSGRVRNAAVGAAVGGGIAAGVTTAVLHDDLDDGLALAVILVLGMVGAGVGFGLGLIPAAYNTIYEVEVP